MKLGVVGGGRWGINHIRTLHSMGVLSGIVEYSDQRRNQLADMFAGVATFKFIQDSLDCAEAFTVCVPAEHHHSVAKELLLAGKHVLVEKPLTLNSTDGIELCELAKQNGLILMVGHLLLFHPAIQKLKLLVDSGRLGKLQYIYSNRVNLGTVRSEENSLWSFAPHDISVFRHLVGADPIEVSCDGGAFIQPAIHDTTVTVLKYPNNVVGHIFVSWLHPFKEHRMVVIGSKAMVSFEDSSSNKALILYNKGIDIINGEPVKRDGDVETIPYEIGAPLENELRHFMACAAGHDRNNLIPGTAGVDVLRTLEMAERSLHGTAKHLPIQPTAPMATDHFVHPTAVIDDNVSIGRDTKIWHFSHVLPNCTIGEQCTIGQNVTIGKNVTVGNFVKIQNNVSVYEGVELHDYVFCGPSCVFTNILSPKCKYPQASAEFYQKTIVREGASIGANATIVCGVTLGQHCLIGAGAVVTKDVPDYAVVVGNPAKMIGWVSEAGIRLVFENEISQICPKSGKQYERTPTGLFERVSALVSVPTILSI